MIAILLVVVLIGGIGVFNSWNATASVVPELFVNRQTSGSSAGVSPDIQFMQNVIAPSHKSNFNRNINGQTYGSSADIPPGVKFNLCLSNPYFPELIKARGVDGTIGYVYFIDTLGGWDFWEKTPKDLILCHEIVNFPVKFAKK